MDKGMLKEIGVPTFVGLIAFGIVAYYMVEKEESSIRYDQESRDQVVLEREPLSKPSKAFPQSVSLPEGNSAKRVTETLVAQPVREPKPEKWDQFKMDYWCSARKSCAISISLCDPSRMNEHPPAANVDGVASCFSKILDDGYRRARELEKKREWYPAWVQMSNLSTVPGYDGRYDKKIKSLKTRAMTNKKTREAKAAREAAQERKREAKRAQQRAIEEMMNPVVADNGMAFAVGGVKLRRSIGDTYLTSKGARYLLVSVIMANTSSRRSPVNPHDFTLTYCGIDTSHDAQTYALNHLEAVTLQPGSRTAGWLAFVVQKDCNFRLNYNEGYRTMSKSLVLTK